MSRFPYTCGRAADDLLKAQALLHEHGVLVEKPYPGVVERAVTPCKSCRGAAKSKNCLGWTVDVDRSVALVFAHAKVRDHLVRAELQSYGDYRRAQPASEPEWQAAPVNESIVTVEIFTVADDQLVARQHIDLANVRQPGPIWHLQSGGNPSGELAFELDWLNVPRWSSTPADLVLAADALAFNLHHQAWQRMQQDGRWVRLVLQAEDLLMTHYVRKLCAHFQKRADDRDISWLYVQDNLGEWNPRPSPSNHSLRNS